MKTFEVKGFWGFCLFSASILFLVSIATALPISLTWLIWNAFIGDVLHGPTLNLLQAVLLTLAIGVGLKLIFQPQISFEIKRVNLPEENDQHLPH